MTAFLLASLALLIGVTVANGPPWRAPDWREALDRLGVIDERIRAVMKKVRRGDFLPWDVRHCEADDRPLSIGFDQTSSQPSLIAEMLEALRLEPGAKVLEVGTGCGYQTALLSELGAQVFSIELIEPLAERAARRLAHEGYSIQLRTGDGYLGWPEAAPFDGIVVCASAPRIPEPLVEQLAAGGRLVIPVGGVLQRVTKSLDGQVEIEPLLPVTFVPLTGPLADHDREVQSRGADDDDADE
jgi:protein-L-isoaspartate(D-aspartate) O-methyltransferase